MSDRPRSGTVSECEPSRVVLRVGNGAIAELVVAENVDSHTVQRVGAKTRV